jgi:hypothetical protein
MHTVWLECRARIGPPLAAVDPDPVQVTIAQPRSAPPTVGIRHRSMLGLSDDNIDSLGGRRPDRSIARGMPYALFHQPFERSYQSCEVPSG